MIEAVERIDSENVLEELDKLYSRACKRIKRGGGDFQAIVDSCVIMAARNEIERYRARDVRELTDENAVIQRVLANELEEKTIRELADLVRHGHKFIDIHVRKDAREYHFEGDWLARLFR